MNLDDFPPLHGESCPRIPPTTGASMRSDSCPRVSPSRVSPHDKAANSVSGGSPTDAAPHGSSWSSLFSSEVKLQFIALTVKDGKKSVHISKSVIDKGTSLWEDYLIGQFFAISPKLAIIQSVMDKLWGKSGKGEVIPLVGDGFMFKFGDPNAKAWVVDGGPSLLPIDLFSQQ